MRHFPVALAALIVCTASGCYVPLCSPGVKAACLPDEFRTPLRTGLPPLNLSNLTAVQPDDYILGPRDVLEVLIPELYPGATERPLRVAVMADGKITLPLLEPLHVAGGDLAAAQRTVTAAYANGFLKSPRVNLVLLERSQIDVVVLGEVAKPGVYQLPKYENDVGHALATAGGLTPLAGQTLEIHRRVREDESRASRHPAHLERIEYGAEPKKLLTISLRGLAESQLGKQDIELQRGDVINVPRQPSEVFFVVGKLNLNTSVRFNNGDREREHGNAFLLPRDREIDVVTAVAMAGYIDPIDSPSTVTVHRHLPEGEPMLIRVDLIKARYRADENVLVRPGDIIYLNPDAAWWFRRTFDRVVPELILIPYRKLFRDL